MALPLAGLALRGLAGGAAARPPKIGPIAGPQVTLEVTGVEQMIQVLQNVTPRHANNLMRNTIRGIAAEIRKDIRKNAPKGSTGTLSKARNVKLKMRRAIKGAHIAEVQFTDRSFYWRFVEHGTAGANGSPSQPFVGPARMRAVSRLDQMLLRSFSRTLEKTMKRELKKQARARR